MRTSILVATAAAGLALLACSDRRADDMAGREELLSRATASAGTPGSLALGGSHTCILDRRGVTCWGNNTSHELTVPALRHPTQLTGGSAHTCALDDDGVKCWGSNSSMQGTVPALRQPTQVSAGNLHTCALDADGLKCWGNNSFLQTTVPALRQPTQVSAGANHTCALHADGVKCWGSNTLMQTTVPPLHQPTQISAGSNHTCALDADGVKCWGNNSFMQTTVPPLRNPRQLAAGGFHTCALDDDGVKCWGSNSSMQSTVPPLRRPTLIRSGRSHSCAIDDGDVVCWGNNIDGQTTIPEDLELWGRHACVGASGGLLCTGDNEHGQLGVGSDQDRVVALAGSGPIDLGRAFGAPVESAMGHAFGCALGGGGAVKCWGYNGYGQLGLGDTRDRGIAQQEMGDGLPELQFGSRGPMTKIDVGDDHACALNGQGEVFCWGNGSSGQLGTEATDDVGAAGGPTRPHLKAGLVVRDLALGHGHTCVLSTDGAVYCFGDNDDGQLGSGRTGAIGDRPGTMGAAMQPVSLGDDFHVKAIASGDRHVCALSEDGRVKCWGAAETGQLGLGDTTRRGTSADDMGNALPAVDLGHGQFAVELRCGSRHCCARTIQNTMKCWGDNSQGQLGLGDLLTRGNDVSSTGDNLPFVPTPPHERVLSIQLDGDHTCARTDSGLRCWGRNRSGELGYGDRESRGGSFTTVPRLLAPLGI